MRDIIAIIEEEERKAEASGQLASDRQEALERYLGEPYGDEIEGRSQVVSRDLFDTVEWIMPALMKLFMSGDEVVKFTPTGREDMEAAEQETDYLNWLALEKQANAFLLFYTWFTDALLQRNGYIKDYWESKEDTSEETYDQLSDDELAMIMSDEAVEIIEHEEYPAPMQPGMMQPGMMQPGMMPQGMMPQGMMSMMPVYHRIRVRKRTNYGCAKSVNIPPERVLVSSRSMSPRPQDADFVEHWEYRTVSDLRADGYDVPDDIGGDDGPSDTDFERDRFSETSWMSEEGSGATRRVKVREVWIKFDDDGDGIAELRHLIVVGKTALVDEAADLIPISCISPRPWPHRHIGLSLHDEVKDLARIKTSLWRTMLDNLYLANHGRWAISDKVNLDDMLTSRPNGIVRLADGAMPGEGHVIPLVPAQISPQAFQMLEYTDLVRESRTGVNRYFAGTDANALNKTATGVVQLQQAAQEKILLIARIFAETGIRDHFLTLHALTLKHGRKTEVLRLRGTWVAVDPRQWKERRDMTVSVGLGTGNRDAQLGHLMTIWQLQMQALPFGMVTPQNLLNTAQRITQNAGFKDADAFWTDPQHQQQPQQPQQPPDAALLAQAEIRKAEIQAQTDLQVEQMRGRVDIMQELIKAEVKKQIEAMQSHARPQMQVISG